MAATTWSPAFTWPIRAAVTAAMPLAVARAASAPSSSAMRASNIATVGIREARVDEARVLALEAGLGGFHRVVDEPLGQEHGFGGLAEGGPHGAAVHQAGGRAQRLVSRGGRRAGHRSYARNSLSSPLGTEQKPGARARLPASRRTVKNMRRFVCECRVALGARGRRSGTRSILHSCPRSVHAPAQRPSRRAFSPRTRSRPCGRAARIRGAAQAPGAAPLVAARQPRPAARAPRPGGCGRASCPGRDRSVARRHRGAAGARDRPRGGRCVLEPGTVTIAELDEQPGAAARHFGRRQSEELDRAHRRLHPRHHRPGATLRPDRGGLRRTALCRDLARAPSRSG